MRKIKNRRVELPLTIIAGVFFIAVVALFFLIPTLDNAFEAHPAGLSPYNPLELFVGGIKALVSFNFASTKYLIIFATGALIILLMLVWLVFIIVKKKPIKLVYWFIVLAMVAGSAFIVSGYVLAVARTVTVYGKGVMDQTVIDDLRGLYDTEPNYFVLDARVYKDAVVENGYNVATVVISAAVIFHTDIRVLAWVLLAFIAIIAVFGILIPLLGFIGLVKKPKEVSDEETEEERAAREAREAAEQSKRDREAQYVAYVEYAAGKEAREKEYRELCKANGIAVADEGEAYYKELSKLPVFTGEVVDEDEEYYKRLARELGALNGSAAPSDDDYYKALAKELPVLQQQDLNGETHEEYVRRLSRELPVLKEQNLDAGESEEEYIARLSKELPALKAQVLETPEDREKYIARLAKELPVLNEEAKEESEEEYKIRLAKELPVLNQKEAPKKVDYHEELAQELALFRLIEASREAELGRYYRDIIRELDETDKLREEEDEALARGLKESVRAKKAYYKRMKEQLPCLNREKLADE